MTENTPPTDPMTIQPPGQLSSAVNGLIRGGRIGNPLMATISHTFDRDRMRQLADQSTSDAIPDSPSALYWIEQFLTTAKLESSTKGTTDSNGINLDGVIAAIIALPQQFALILELFGMLSEEEIGEHPQYGPPLDTMIRGILVFMVLTTSDTSDL